jgi:hypothetical protein
MELNLQNNIIQIKYTSGGEYKFVGSSKEYVGYYYNIGKKTYAGERFDIRSPELIELSAAVSLKDNPSIFSSGLSSQKISSIPFVPNNRPMLRYFAKKITQSDSITIKEINKVTFDQLKSNPLYQTAEIEFSYNLSEQQLDEINKLMPGLGSFIEDDINSLNTSGDDSRVVIVNGQIRIV